MRVRGEDRYHQIMLIYYGNQRRMLRMYSTRTYIPEELLNMCLEKPRPYWVHLGDSRYIRINNQDNLAFACEIVCAYHNQLVRNRVPSPDGFTEEMAEIERVAQERMDNPESDGDGYVTSDEDMSYSDFFYM